MGRGERGGGEGESATGGERERCGEREGGDTAAHRGAQVHPPVCLSVCPSVCVIHIWEAL